MMEGVRGKRTIAAIGEHVPGDSPKRAREENQTEGRPPEALDEPGEAQQYELSEALLARYQADHPWQPAYGHRAGVDDERQIDAAPDRSDASSESDGTSDVARRICVGARAEGRTLFERAALADMDEGLVIIHRAEALAGIYSPGFSTCTAILLRSANHVGLEHVVLMAFEDIHSVVETYRRETGAPDVDVSVHYSEAGFLEDADAVRSHCTLEQYLEQVPVTSREAVQDALARVPAADADSQWHAVTRTACERQFAALKAWCDQNRISHSALPSSNVLVTPAGAIVPVASDAEMVSPNADLAREVFAQITRRGNLADACVAVADMNKGIAIAEKSQKGLHGIYTYGVGSCIVTFLDSALHVGMSHDVELTPGRVNRLVAAYRERTGAVDVTCRVGYCPSSFRQELLESERDDDTGSLETYLDDLEASIAGAAREARAAVARMVHAPLDEQWAAVADIATRHQFKDFLELCASENLPVVELPTSDVLLKLDGEIVPIPDDARTTTIQPWNVPWQASSLPG